MAQLPSSRNENRSLAHRRHPFHALRAMQHQMDRWFDRMVEPGFTEFETDLLPSLDFAPSVDIEETDKEYILNFDIPGMRKEDIKIDLRDNLLTVSGERRIEREEKSKKGPVRSERFFGSFQRSFNLPASIKPEQVSADYADGVLCLKVPKPAENKSQQIKIGGQSTKH